MLLSRRTASLAAGLALTAGGGGAALAASSAGASPVTTTTAAATTSGATSGSVAKAHHGRATISVTGPMGRSRSHSVNVRCRVRGSRLIIMSGRAHAHKATTAKPGRSRNFTRLVVDGTSAGNHPASLTVVHRSGSELTLRRVSGQATVGAGSGSFTWTKTLSGKHNSSLAGKTVKVSETWTCSV